MNLLGEVVYLLATDPVTYAREVRSTLTIQATVPATLAAQRYVTIVAEHNLKRLPTQTNKRR